MLFSIRSKLYTYIFLILFLPMAILGILTIHQSVKSLKFLVYRQLEASVTNILSRSETKFNEITSATSDIKNIESQFDAYLKEIVSDSRNSKPVYIFIIDNRGNYIRHRDKNNSVLTANIRQSLSPTLLEAGSRMLTEKKGQGFFYDNSGINYIYFASFTPKLDRIAPDYKGNLNRYFAAVTPGAPVMNAANTTLKVFLITGFITISIAFIIGILLIKTSITDNINKLIDAMEHVADGDLDTNIHIKSHDELGYIGSIFNIMTKEISASRRTLVLQEKLRSEIEIAEKIQTSLIPENPESEYYDISSIMIPAEDIGGDYYDFIKKSDTEFWIGLGDVSGHGYKSGLIMMMAQTALASIIRSNPEISTKDAYTLVNELLFNNIHKRMKETNYMTLVLLDLHNSGLVKYAGAHIDMFLYRADSGEVESIKTKGIWSAILIDISDKVEEKTFTINTNDVLLIFTDGLMEGMDTNLNQYGIQKIKQILKQNNLKPANEIKNELLKDFFSFIEHQRDDITFIVVKKIK